MSRIIDLGNTNKNKKYDYIFWIDIKKYETDKTIYTIQMNITTSVKINNHNILHSITMDLFKGLDSSLQNPIEKDTIHMRNLVDKYPGKNKYLVTNFKLIND